MPSPSDRHHRRSVRLRHYDYSQAGAYFLTICSKGRQCLFGQVIDGEIVLSDIGQVVASEWERTAEIRKEVELDAWVVMPNHLHAVVIITQSLIDIAAAKPPPHILSDASIRGMGSIKKSLSSLVQGFKSATTKPINVMRGTPRVPVWQRGLWEHVIRNEDDLKRIREYIANNPRRWLEDENNPARIRL
jgi:REP element-mobilizing transposase RayT